MITTADKLNMVVSAFSLFSVLILLLIALSWYRKKRLSLFNKVAILIVLAGMAAFADAYWIEPNWLQTEQVVIHDPELADVFNLGDRFEICPPVLKVVQISDIHLQGGIGERERGAGKPGGGFAQSQDPVSGGVR